MLPEFNKSKSIDILIINVLSIRGRLMCLSQLSYALDTEH